MPNSKQNWEEEFVRKFPYRTRDIQEYKEKENIASFIRQQIEKANQEGYEKGRLRYLEQGGCVEEIIVAKDTLLNELKEKIEEKLAGFMTMRDNNQDEYKLEIIAEILTLINSYKQK